MASILDLTRYGLQVSWVLELHESQRIDPRYYAPIFLDMDKKLRNSINLEIAKLVSICQVTYGHMPMEDYVNKADGLPFIRVTNLKDGLFIDTTDLKYISKDASNKEEHRIKNGEILVAQNGFSTGKVAFASQDVEGYIFPSFCLKLHNFINIDSGYLATYLASYYGQLQISRGLKVGSVHPNTTKSDVEDIIVPLPDKKIQQYIGNKVRKAEVLRKEAECLRLVAEAKLNQLIGIDLINTFELNTSLFNWVDTMLVGSTRMDADYYKTEYLNLHRFLVDNKGRFEKLSDMVKLSKKRANLGDYGHSFLYLDISSLNQQTGIFDKNRVQVTEAPSRAQRRVQTNDVLVSTVRPNRKGIGLVAKDFDGQIASTGFAVLSTKNFKTDPYFLYLLLGSDLVTKQLVRMTSGGLYPAISEDELMDIYIPVVGEEYQKDIGSGMKIYFENLICAKQLIDEAKQDVENLIEGNFDESKISEGV